MLRDSRAEKVTESHLRRDAYLYVRQSTLHQVVENTESTKRQYRLRERAVALGWPIERIHVVDSDQGQSGASSEREGFQKLVAEVGLGRVGIVLGLEVSRLARKSSDWHRLLEICAFTSTLILDEDGIYDPSGFNDRLLLGLKGTMSEAELHVLRARLVGGILNKARRGELQGPLPVGLVYDESGTVKLDPDKRVQNAFHFFFRTFREVGSATATVKAFRERKILFPRRLRQGPKKGELHWEALRHSHALSVLHNPRYAGAFFFGRSRQRKLENGKVKFERLPRDQWTVLIPHCHEGYISWSDFEENERRLLENAQSLGMDRRRSPPREGPALLQGLVICGVCGRRMTVRYHTRGEKRIPDYLCQRDAIENATKQCQVVPGESIDEAVGALLVDAVTPVTLEAALAVHEQIQARLEEADQLRQQRVERARYEADVARRRFMQVDPENRLVADSLEGEWNEKLRLLEQAQEDYEQQREADRTHVEGEQKAQILRLATDFPGLWRNALTPQRERKRMLRLLIEDVTMVREQKVTLHVRFKGGASRTLHLPLPLCSWQRSMTDPEIVKEIDRLLEDHTDSEIAALLNERGLRSGSGKEFSRNIVRRIGRSYGLKSRFDRLREKGLLTVEEMAILLKVDKCTVRQWGNRGLLSRERFGDKPEYLYARPVDPPQSRPGLRLSKRTKAGANGVRREPAEEV